MAINLGIYIWKGFSIKCPWDDGIYRTGVKNVIIAVVLFPTVFVLVDLMNIFIVFTVA